jgi:hypothetical protein
MEKRPLIEIIDFENGLGGIIQIQTKRVLIDSRDGAKGAANDF